MIVLLIFMTIARNTLTRFITCKKSSFRTATTISITPLSVSDILFLSGAVDQRVLVISLKLVSSERFSTVIYLVCHLSRWLEQLYSIHARYEAGNTS